MRPRREPRSARTFWGRSGCCSRRNLRNEELCRNPGSRSSDVPRAMQERATLRLLCARINRWCDASLWRKWVRLRVWLAMVLRAALSECGQQRQRGGCVPSFRGGLPGQSPSIMGVFSVYPPALTLHSPRVLRIHAPRGLSGGSSNGHVGLDGDFAYARWMLLMFNGFARALSCMPMDRPQCIQILSLSSTHYTHRINTI